MSKLLTALAALSTLACAPTGRSSVTPTAEASSPTPQPVRPTTVLLVRHAEKDTSDPEDRDPPLTPAGVERAQCLATMLEDAPVTHLVATDLRRTRATLEPLASQHGVELTTVRGPELEQATREAVEALPPGSFAVVASHSNLIPSLVRSWGGKPRDLDERGFIPDESYDRIVMIQWTDDDPLVVPFRFCAASVSAS